MIENDPLRPGENVVLIAVPPGLLNGLPDQDQRAITTIVGKPVLFVGYEDGRARLDLADPFDRQTDTCSHTHTIWVAPKFIKRLRR